MHSEPLTLPRPVRRGAGAALAAVALAVIVAGCGASGGSPANASHKSKPAASATTLKLATVGSLGKVLVNAQGRTLYTLSSEHSGSLTCTSSSGCTSYWHELDLPQGSGAPTVAGGLQASKVGTEAGTSGGKLVTYGGWPLYTFTGDSGSGQAHGQGVKSFGGTWWAVNASGAPVTSSASSTPTPSSGGYSY